MFDRYLVDVSSVVFIHPWCFLLLPIPLIIYRLIPAYRTKQAAIKVPFFDTLVDALGEKPTEGASQLTPQWWQRVILLISWLLVVAALAKPTVLGEPQVRERLGRDVMVVLDLSGSMAEPDFTTPNGQKNTRLAAAKQVLADFAETRKGDRLGLILFGDAAFIQTPFTSDLTAWLALLEQTDVAMAGQSTHLGDAIGLAIKVFDQSYYSDANNSEPREKVVIVLTDGNDTGSFVEPIDASKVAAAKGVRIHTIAMGDPTTVGEQALDMDTIEKIASVTGGKAFEALNHEELVVAYQTIGELEPQLYESTTYRAKHSVHHYLIMIVVALYLLAFCMVCLRRWLQNSIVSKREATSLKQSEQQEGACDV